MTTIKVEPSLTMSKWEALDYLNKHNLRAFHKYLDDREQGIEKICRNHVVPPIKGEITRSKLRWRGVSAVVLGPEHEFLGLEQRGFLIDINGNKTKLS